MGSSENRVTGDALGAKQWLPLETRPAAHRERNPGKFSFFHGEEGDVVVVVEEIGIKLPSLFHKKGIAAHRQGNGKMAGAVGVHRSNQTGGDGRIYRFCTCSGHLADMGGFIDENSGQYGFGKIRFSIFHGHPVTGEFGDPAANTLGDHRRRDLFSRRTAKNCQTAGENQKKNVFHTSL